MVWSRLFGRSPTARAAEALYATTLAQSRQPVFYRDWGVPDTLDGRFDLISLHMVLVMRRLKEKALAPLSQALFDTYFSNLDGSLREMGVGDLTVPKRIRAMAEAFYGRIAAYEAAFAQTGSPDALIEALARNVYRAEAGTVPSGAPLLAEYARRQDRHLASLPDDALTAGRIGFLPVESAPSEVA